MSLADCLKKANAGKEVFSKKEISEIYAIANKKIGKVSVGQAEIAAVQELLDQAISERQELSDMIREESGIPVADAGEHAAVDAVLKPEVKTEQLASAKSTSEPIEDFGEKIIGARKEYAAAYKDRMAEAKTMDTMAQPLSKSWPEPDYQKLVDSGYGKNIVGLVRSMRDEIPNKPGKEWKQKTWAKQVEMLRETADQLLNDKEFADKFISEMNKTEHLKLEDAINGRAELYAELGHEKSLKGIRISRSQYGVYNGVPYNPPKIIWEVTKDAKSTAFGNMPRTLGSGDTRQAAIDSFAKAYSTLDTSKEKSSKTKFEIYADRYAKAGDKGQYFIGKKVGRNVLHIKDGIDSVKEAREYIASNNEELTAILEKKKEIPNERYDTNNPRVGQDMRNGQDVTPQMFSDAFGFRGVQFGNYVEGARRQKDLNDAYDALMDLAAVLDITPKAISLNGELGLAFGARGTGGKNPHSAHYESGHVVINLTKGSGAGSLAHEWWHSLDNYFSRMSGKKDEYATDRRDVSLAARDSEYQFKDDGIRKEMINAFGSVVKAINGTAIKQRSGSLDARRTKEYWGTGIEMSARAFERYVISKLHDNGFANDYLANVVSEEYWNSAEALGIGEGGSYPYPTESELPSIRGGFDNFFQTIESKETDKGTALYSASARVIPEAKQLSAAQLTDIVDQSMAKLAHQPKIMILDSLTDHTGRADDAGRASGEVRNGTIYLYRDAIANGHDAVRTIWHELLHYGIRRFLTADEYIKSMNDLAMRDGYIRKLAKQWADSPEADASRRYAAKQYDLKHRVDAYAMARGVDEILATFSESIGANGTDYAKNDAFNATLRAVRNWMALLADKIGMKQVGEWIRGMDNKEAREYVHNMLGKLRRDDPASNDHWAFTADGAYMVAWHGSPHDHDKFDSSKIRTGEGVQAYGHGLYFAGNKDVAEWYKKNLTKGRASSILVDGQGINPDVIENQDTEISMAVGFLSAENNDIEKAIAYASDIGRNDIAETLGSGRITVKNGRLYQVELAPSEDEYLLWDRPLSEQSEKVKAALNGIGIDTTKQPTERKINGKYVSSPVELGKDFYSSISEKLAPEPIDDLKNGGWGSYTQTVNDKLANDKAASELLHAAGIRGIKYLDGSSRGKGDSNFNYVIFNDADVEITAKFSSAQSYPELGAVISEQDAIDKGFKLKVYRGISKSKPFNDSGTVWATTSKEVAQAYADEVFGYDDAAVITMMVNTDGIRKTNMRTASDEVLDSFEYNTFTSPQDVGIYQNSDDSPLGSGYPHTAVHVPIENTVIIDNGNTQTYPELAAALEQYEETGELATVSDLANEVQRLIDEDIAPDSLQSAIEDYRQEFADDHNIYAGRGDMDAADERFVDAVRAALTAKQSRTTKPLSNPQTVESVAKATQALRNRWTGFRNIKIVQSVKEVPNDIYLRALRALKPIDQGTEGIYDPASKTVYLIADNLASPERAVWVAAHEVVGHGGIRMLGGDVAAALNHAAKNGFVAQLAKAIAADRKETYNKDEHVDEAIAELAAATITGDTDAILDRYGVKVPVGMRSNLLGMIRRVVDAIRKFFAQISKKPEAEVTDSDILGLIRQMKVKVEGEMQEAWRGNAGLAMASTNGERKGISGEAFARMAIEEFVAENDPVFIHDVSSSKSLEGVMADVVDGSMYLGEHTRNDERDETGADRRYVFKTAKGHMFYVFETDDGKVWINVEKLEPGSGGQSIYAAVANYAYNTRKQFIGDPVGVSKAAVVRRTSNMLSSALRFGTTRHLDAAKEQIKGDVDNGIEPLDWHGSDIDKVEALIHTFVKTMQNLYPSLKEYRYDFNNQQFTRLGKPVLSIQPDSLESIRQDDGRGVDSTQRIGEKTARRAILLQTLIESQSEGLSARRSGILEQLLRWGNTSSPGNLNAIFSRSAEKNDVHGNRAGNAEPKRILREGNKGGIESARPPRQNNIHLQGGQLGNRASWDAPEPSMFDDLVYKLQDKHIDLKRVLQAIRDTGTQVSEQWNAYLQEELFHGRAAKRVQDFVNTELKPMMIEMAQRGMKLADLDQYLHARHAKEANALIAARDPSLSDGGSGMTNQEADDYFASLPDIKRKQLEASAKRVDTIISKTREYYASYGLVSRDQVDGWAQMFKHYVPLMREDHDGGMGIGQGFSIKGKEAKHRTGSTAKVVDILANIAMQREKAIVRGEKNRVSVALAGLAMLNPNADFWTFGKPPTERVLNKNTGLVEERADPTFKSKANVVVAKIKDSNGQVHERAVIFNERNERAMRMAEAIKNLDATQLGGLLGVSAVVTRYFSAINTQYNPIFGVTNLVRDVGGMALNLSSTPLAGRRLEVMGHILSAAKGIYLDARAERKGHPATSKWAELWEELQDQGGMTGYRDLYRTSEDRAKAIEHELDPHNWVNNKWGQVFTAAGTLKVPLTKAQDVAAPLFDWLSDYNLMMEGSTRLSIYKTALDHGLTRQEAASLAKNTTVNFNRKGQSGMQAGAMYAFFNAAMQGTARIGENMFDMKGGDIKTLRLSKTGQKIVAAGVLLGVIQALALAAAGFDDDEPPEFIRQRNLIFPLGWAIGGKRYIAIPMPLGYHFIPNIGRIATEYAMGGFKKTADHVLSLIGIFAEAFNPIGGAGISMQTITPTAFDPFAALDANKDWTGKTIYKEDFNSLEPTPGFTRNKDTASIWSKFMAKGINYATGGTDYVPGTFSPTADQIDYLIGQVTGGVGREVSKGVQTGQAILTGEELPTHKIPLVGRFYGNLDDQSSQGSRYYTNLKELNMIDSELTGRLKDDLPTEDFEKNNPKHELIGLAKGIDTYINQLRREKSELIRQGADRNEIREIETKITDEMRELNESVAEVR